MNYNHTKNCKYCGKQFHSQREDARFCSSTCRVHFHLNKSNKNIAKETFNTNILNINENVSDDNISGKEIKEIVHNKQKALKLFLLAHHKEINELIYDLGLFSEEEYSALSNFTERVMELLFDLETNPNRIIEMMPEIKKLILEYDLQ